MSARTEQMNLSSPDSPTTVHRYTYTASDKPYICLNDSSV